jgi:hypothetical protein
MVEKKHRKTGEEVWVAYGTRSDKREIAQCASVTVYTTYPIGPDLTGGRSGARGGKPGLGRPDRFDHVAADVAEIPDGYVFKTYAPPIELFVDFDGRLLHDGMGFGTSTDEKKVLAAGQPRLSVVTVKGQPQQGGRFGGLIGGSHDCLSLLRSRTRRCRLNASFRGRTASTYSRPPSGCSRRLAWPAV